MLLSPMTVFMMLVASSMSIWLFCSPIDWKAEFGCSGSLWMIILFRRLFMSTTSRVSMVSLEFVALADVWGALDVSPRMMFFISSCVGIFLVISAVAVAVAPLVSSERLNRKSSMDFAVDSFMLWRSSVEALSCRSCWRFAVAAIPLDCFIVVV